MMAADATRPHPRGGRVLTVTRRGQQQEFADLWCIDPETLAERVITVWADGELPQSGDEVWWWPGQSPGWRRQGEMARRCFLPRVGASFDPWTGKR